MKTILFSFYIACVLMTFVIGCTSKETAPVPVKTKKELLSQKSWLINKWETKTPSTSWIDEYASWPVCSKDDAMIFKTTQAYELNEGVISCNPPSLVIETGTWQFESNETKININVTGPRGWEIEQLSETTLIISFIDNTPGSISTRVTLRH
jgi:hypothetical protein